MNESKMTIDVNEKPPIAKWIVLAIQHVFAMFGATILVPILVNVAAVIGILINLCIPENRTKEQKEKMKKEKEAKKAEKDKSVV